MMKFAVKIFVKPEVHGGFPCLLLPTRGTTTAVLSIPNALISHCDAIGQCLHLPPEGTPPDPVLTGRAGTVGDNDN